MQKQNLSQGGFVPKNRQHNRKTKYPDKVTKPKCLVLVRIFLFSSVGIKIQYFPTAPFNFQYIHLSNPYLDIYELWYLLSVVTSAPNHTGGMKAFASSTDLNSTSTRTKL